MDDEAEAKPNDTMNSGRLSAAEKGKQKAAADLPAAPLVLQSAGGGSRGLPRHLLVQPSGTSEIEELPPYPPRPAPSSPRLGLPALDADDDDAPAAVAAVAGLGSKVTEIQAALDSRLRMLERMRDQLLREIKEASSDEPEPEPEVAGAGAGGGAEAEVQMLQNHLGTMEARVSGMMDAMLAFRFQAEEMQALEEFWKPVVPERLRLQPQRQRNHSKAELEQMKALEEFWKPVVPVSRQRNNSKRKINWKQIISLVALTSWLVPYISLWILLPVNLADIVGAIFVLWILRSTYSCCQRLRTSRTISRHVPRLICVCFWLLVLYVLYLILRTIHGAFAGLLGKHQ